MNRAVSCAVAMLMVCAPLLAGNPFHNTDNTRWATRCNGPQGAIIIRDDRVVSVQAGMQAALASAAGADLVRAAHTVELLKRIGLASPRARAAFPRLVFHTRNNRLQLPDLASAQAQPASLGDPANDLTFVFENWDPSEEAALRDYLNVAYPKAKLIYGPPAFNITVKIIRDPSIQELQGGVYDATNNEIRMPGLTGNFPEDTFILMILVLHAFHDDVALFYDAWEQGFAGAAATAVQTTPGVAPGYNPYDPGPFYCLSVYECENQPALANPTYYPASGFAGMLVWRIAMARAAWFKCYIEDPSFFANFNRRYYDAFYEGLQGDVPALKDICAQVLPQVEGMNFYDWFERQYVLDTSVRVGLKLYTWNVPLEQSVALIVEHYFTGAGGDESPRGGEAQTIYWDHTHTLQLYAEEGNSIYIPASGSGAGEGFLMPTFFNIGGAQRITIQVDLNGLQGIYIYPYMQRSFDPAGNNLYGSPLGPSEGSLDIVGGNGASGLTVSRGVFGTNISGGPLSPMQLQVTFTNAFGQSTTRHVNVGWDSYCLFIDGGRQGQVSHSWEVGTNGLHMMSLPVTPLQTDAAAILGIAPQDLLLARWDPSLPPNGAYRIWPDIEPFAMGRGFWLRIFAPLNVTVQGIAADDNADFPIDLKLGWNMIGIPRTSAIAVDSLKVDIGSGAPLSLEEAAQNHILQRGVFGYSQTEGYRLVDTLYPFEGYWVRCISPAGCRLLVPPLQAASATTTALSGTAKRDPLPNLAWKLPLVARAGKMLSRAYLGCAQGATEGIDPRYDAQAPPLFGPYVTCRFVREADQGAFVTDVRPTGRSKYTWQVEVATNQPGVPVILAWPDMSQLPPTARPVLVDEASGRRLYMRTTTRYEIPGLPEGVTRRLRIEIGTAGGKRLAVTSLAHCRTAGGIEVAYNLSAEAAVTATVLNIAGRPVRQLVTDRLQAAGSNILLWNLRDNNGCLVPSGTYLLRLEARGATGQRVSALRTMQVARK